ATSHHERMQELYKQSAATLEQLEQAQQRLSDVTAQVAATQEMLREAEIHLHYSTVAAPFTGVIGERFVDPGDFVWPGRPLFSIYDPETARVEAMIPERYIQQLSLGMESKVEVEALGKVFTAKVAEIRPHVDPKTRAFVTKCDVTDGDKQLFPGMFGTLLFQTGERSAILVPSNAVHQLGQLSFIWVQVGREWQKRYVTLGRSHEGDRIEILSGISANETIAVMNRGTRG
ncbi:MAG: efflux RND transporter periplasmic adaptor subunit, partial [Chlamydiia bacterium]|nr:efflux RND transporter periplasmic adaptor subunit [Chlamydiia bacterium]